MSSLPARGLGRPGAAIASTPMRASQHGADPAEISESLGRVLRQRFREGTGRLRGFTAVPIRDIHLRSDARRRAEDARQHRERLRVRGDRGVRAVDRVHELREPGDGASDAAREGGRAAQVRRRHQSATDSPVHRRVAVADRRSPSRSRRESSLRRSSRSRPSSSAPSASTTSRDPQSSRRSLRSRCSSRPAPAATPRFSFRRSIPCVRCAAKLHAARPRRRSASPRGPTVLDLDRAHHGTFVVFAQQRFAETMDLGYEKERIVVLTGSQAAALGPQWESMKRQLASVPGVEAVTASNVVPGTRTRRSNASQKYRRRRRFRRFPCDS